MNLHDNQLRSAQRVRLSHHQFIFLTFDVADQSELVKSLLLQDLAELGRLHGHRRLVGSDVMQRIISKVEPRAKCNGIRVIRQSSIDDLE